MEKGNYDLFLIDDLLKSSRIRIPHYLINTQRYAELESEIYIYSCFYFQAQVQVHDRPSTTSPNSPSTFRLFSASFDVDNFAFPHLIPNPNLHHAF